MNQVEAHWRTLQRHPVAHVPPAHEQLVVNACAQRLSADVVQLGFRVLGDVSQFVIPPFEVLKCGDDLWRSTCFEVFCAPKPGDTYIEMNASPSGAWALYSFDGYRKRSSERVAVRVDGIETTLHAQEFLLTAKICGLKSLSALPGRCKLGLCAVMEDNTGVCSYWALAHVPGKPDFHKEATFVAAL